MSRRAATATRTALAFLLPPSLAGPPTLAHPGHATHAAGAGWVAPLAICGGVVFGVTAVHLRVEGVLSGRAAAAGGVLGAVLLAVGVGAFAGVV